MSLKDRKEEKNNRFHLPTQTRLLVAIYITYTEAELSARSHRMKSKIPRCTCIRERKKKSRHVAESRSLSLRKQLTINNVN